MGYLRTLALSISLIFAAVWIWIAAMPMAFMDIEYPSWRAKSVMLQHCDLGSAVILGDSRAAADILPVRLPFRAANLAVGGGEAIEAVAASNRMRQCPTRPRMVIISFDPGHFTQADLFWGRSVRFGLIAASDVAALRTASAITGDFSVYEARHTDGLPALLRDWLYQVRFPPLYFASLIHGGGFLRWMRNQQVQAATLTARGQYYFGTSPGSHIVAVDGHMTDFRPLPILDFYFDRLISQLDHDGIDIRFIAMPVNEATWKQVSPAMLNQFAAYLADYERRYSHFHVASDIMPHWPDRFFGDQFCHLNPEGAERFTAELAQRLQAAPPRTQNEAQNGWLSETETEASARVVPISNRGS